MFMKFELCVQPASALKIRDLEKMCPRETFEGMYTNGEQIQKWHLAIYPHKQ